MKTAEEILEKYWNKRNYQQAYFVDQLSAILAAIKEAQKEAATEFFKWHWKNYSSHPNEEEIEERYNEFEKNNQYFEK